MGGKKDMEKDKKYIHYWEKEHNHTKREKKEKLQF